MIMMMIVNIIDAALGEILATPLWALSVMIACSMVHGRV